MFILKISTTINVIRKTKKQQQNTITVLIQLQLGPCLNQTQVGKLTPLKQENIH